MSDDGEEQVTPGEVAQYVGDMAMDLARLAREAGLVAVAAGLEQCHRAAMAEVLAFQSKSGKAAPEDAA